MKKTSTALTLLISTLIITLIVQAASANPFMPSGSWSDEPVPPSIEIQSPNGTYCWNGSDVWLKFTVTKPVTNWYSAGSISYPDYYATTFGNLSQVRFSIDGQQEQIARNFSESALKVYKLYVPTGGILHYSVNVGRLPVGNHTIIINAEGSAYFGNLTHGAFSDSFPVDADASDKTKPVNSSLQDSFLVNGVAPNALPIQPFAVALAAIVALAGAGLLVYFRARRRKSSLVAV